MPIVLKSGSLILLETSGSVQTCNGIALPFLHLFLVPLTSDETDVTSSSEILVYYYQITWHGLSNENRLHSHGSDCLKFHIKISN